MSDITYQLGYAPVMQDDGKEELEPCLGIKKAVFGHSPIWCIPLSVAYIYGEERALMQKCFEIAQFLGMYPDRFLIYRIADLILNYLPDLLHMPPYDEEQVSVNDREIGSGKLKIEGETVQEFGLYQHTGLVS